MAFMADYSLMLQTVLTCTAVLTVLSLMFNWLLTPVKKDLSRVDKEVKTLGRDLKTVEKDLKSDLSRVERDLKDVHLKLDRLLARSAAS